MTQILSTKYMPDFGLEDTTSFFDEHEYPVDSFAFNFDDISYFNSVSASPENTYSSQNKQFHSEITQNNYFPNESPDQSVASATPTKPRLNASSSSSSKIISFDNSNTTSSVTNNHASSQQFYNMDAKVKKLKTEYGYGENLNFGCVISQTDDNKVTSTTTTTNRNSIQARDHVIAERKRREKLSQRFIALSSILPGLKKMDKATILEDAINHMKQLKERVKTLEEQVTDRKVDSAVFVKRTTIIADDDSSSCNENTDQSLPNIEARVSGKDVLFRIHCDKHCGRTTAILNELEKHHLTIQSSSVLPFGNNYLDITIIAQMKKEYCLTIKDLIRRISKVLKNLN